MLTTLTLVAFAGAWIYIVSCPMCYMSDEYPGFVAKRELLEACDLGQVIVLGDSRPNVAIVPSLLTIPTTNLAFNGGGPIEAATWARVLLRCPTLPRLAIVSLDVFHLSQPEPSLWGRGAYFHLLRRNDLSELLATATRLHDRSAFATADTDGLPDQLRIWLYAAWFPSIYFGGLLREGIFLRYWSNLTALSDTLRERGHQFYGGRPHSDAIARDAEATTFQPLPVLDHYFNKMLAAFDAQGIDVALIAMPVNQPTFDAMSPQVRAGISAYLAQFPQRYAHVHTIGDPVPHWPSAYFGDNYSHLNRRGATLYSAQLDVCLHTLLDRGSADIGISCALAPR